MSEVKSRGGGLQISVVAKLGGEPLVPGESVAVSGSCLTVEKVLPDGFLVFASPETVNRTTVGSLKRGSRVNLERAMSASGRFGGHMVSGHVDSVGELAAIAGHGEATELVFDAPKDVTKFIVEKGSVAIDGISLTVNRSAEGRFHVMVIPHTLANTTLSDLRRGDAVNIEVDLIARYVHAFVSPESGGISEKRLAELGWDVG